MPNRPGFTGRTRRSVTNLYRFTDPNFKGRPFISLCLAFILGVVLPTAGLFTLPLPLVSAANSPQTLPFSQNWTNTGLITVNDNWTAVPGIVGFLGDYTTSSPTGVDPQTILQDMTTVDVIANQNGATAPNTLATGGVAEFDGIANPTVALNGSGTADAPNLIFYLDTTGRENINVAYDLRDLDASVDDAVQQVALQYRVGTSGNFTNVPAAYVNDATTGPNLATLVTPINVTLPAGVNNQPNVQVRVVTTNAAGNDEWVGVDNIVVTGSIINSTNPSGTGAASPNTVAVGDSTLLTVAVTPGTNPDSTGHTVTADLSSIGGSPAQTFYDDGTNGDLALNDNTFSFTATVASGTSGGPKSIPATINETAPLSRTGSANISLTVLAPTNPTGTGSANPSSVPAGTMTLLTVNVTPGANPTSTGVTVTADLTTIGGSAAQAFSDNGSNVFTYSATVAPATTPGAKSLPVSILDAEGRTGSTSISLTVSPPPPTHVVISQVYGGGGNSGAPFNRDYVELYNPHTTTFDLTGWSLQYTSATGDTWESNIQPLGGTISPGEYYLVALASGANGAALPAPNIDGGINMSATTGKIALVSNFDPLVGSCPIADPDLVDFVGYGTNANCAEGTRAPAPSNTTALLRKNDGATDTDNNSADFVAGAPNPRRTAPIVEIGPSVFGTDPRNNASSAPRDASMTINFTEPVTVDSGWYDINCAVTGDHNSATETSHFAGKTHVITPNVNFQAGEQCTVTIFQLAIHDVDGNDTGTNADTLPADYNFTFTVATGTPPPYDSSIHLLMGNPNNATNDLGQPDNYLMEKPEFALSYNRSRGSANWVSWHLSDEWVGTLARVDTFRPDPAVPADWYRVGAFDYTGTGFDRGHMVPNADRDKETSIPINQATFLMTNMIPQSPDNNQGPWAAMENYLRTLLPTNELYIVAGGAGTGGVGSNSPASTTTTIANGNVTVPAQTWKVVLVIPKDAGDDISRVTCGSRAIAVIMPNIQGIRNNAWESYLASVDQVETLTGYDFFSNLPDDVEHCVEAGTNGTNPPGTAGQSVTTNEDTAVAITLTASSPSNGPLTYTIVDAPDNGQLTGTDANRTYTPNANYFGPDSFTFKVNDGVNDSNTSTVTITVNSVNDLPVATADSYSTDSNTLLTVPAPGVLSNDSDPVENSALSAELVSNVSNGTLTLNADGSFTYDPDPDFEGTDSFTYHADDGSDDSNNVTVTITVNDKVAPVLTSSVAMTHISSTNSNLFNVGLSASATDNSGDPVTMTVAVVGDENDETPTIGSTVHSPDAKDIAPGTLRLRGERVEANDGRVYLIIVTATDSSGNVSRNYHTVVVPKNNKPANIDLVDAQAAAAASYAQANNGATPPGYFVIGDGLIIGPKQ